MLEAIVSWVSGYDSADLVAMFIIYPIIGTFLGALTWGALGVFLYFTVSFVIEEEYNPFEQDWMLKALFFIVFIYAAPGPLAIAFVKFPWIFPIIGLFIVILYMARYSYRFKKLLNKHIENKDIHNYTKYS